MTIFFMAASPTFAKNLQAYRTIIQTIEAWDSEIILPGSELTTVEAASRDFLDQDDWATLYKRDTDYLQKSDAAIFDATDKATFGVGYLAALALQSEKPSLLLLREGSLQGSIITGLQHPLLTRRFFNDLTVGGIITEFLSQQAESEEPSKGAAA